MKLIKLFEEFIAEAANPDYPVGEYDYSYVDKDFKPLGQPLKLTVTSVPELDNPKADWLMVRLIDHKRGLELYPVDPQNDLTIKTAQPGVFSHPDFQYADKNGTPNPWPAGTAYIKIYKKGEKPQAGGTTETISVSAKTIPELQNHMKEVIDLTDVKWNISQKPTLSFRPNVVNGQVQLVLPYGDSTLTALNLVSNSPVEHLKKQFPDKAALTQQGFKVWGEGITRIANEGETDWAVMYKTGESQQVGTAEAGNFKTGQTYKYQLIDAMGKDVTQKTVTIKPSTRDQTTYYELPSTGTVLAYKVYGNYAEGPNIMADLGPRSLDLQSTDQPNVFWHPDFNDINNKNIYQVRIFPN